ncbi:hypothetical protein GH714_003105 [Hevea brasiliensis]|uniref:Uncharacterized protein n=1 Tax=Hevea brasiliensis TaxID=3981 RepID=A0A6A6KYF5_HEVBR|nr:hypothetical protein GH714_003105 [Hevea brasiliensis]
MVVGAETHVDLSNMVRATFVVSLLDMETIKKWIIMKAQTPMGRFENYDSDEDLNYFGFIAGGLTRLDYPVPISLSLAVVFLVAVFAAASVSAQDLGDLAPAPAPAMDKGAAYSLGMSGAVICSSLFLSMLAFLKH